MTVPSGTGLDAYTGNGVTTLFEFTFRLDNNSDLQVFLDTVLQPTSAFVIQNKTNTGGEIVFNTAPALGVAIGFQRKSSLDQLKDYEPFEEFRADKTEFSQDKLIMLKQETLAFRRDMNLSVQTFINQVTLINDRGTDANIFLWDETLEKAGAYAAEVTQNAPADGSTTTKPTSFLWKEFGIAGAGPAPGNCNKVENVAVLTPTLHVAGEVSDAFNPGVIIGTGSLVDDRADTVYLTNDTGDYSTFGDLIVGTAFIPNCQGYNYAGPQLFNKMAAPHFEIAVGVGWQFTGTGTNVLIGNNGISGIADRSTILTDTDSVNVYEAFEETPSSSVTAGQPMACRFIVFKETATTNFTRFVFRNTIDPFIGIKVLFNAVSGAIFQLAATDGVNPAFEVRDNVDWWEIYLQVDANGDRAQLLIDAAWNTDGGESKDATALGPIRIGDFEVFDNFTIGRCRGGAAEPRPAGPTSVIDISNDHIPIANHSNTLTSGYFLEWRPQYGISEIVNDIEILSLNNAAGLLFYDVSLQLLTATDGTNTATVPLVLQKERKYRLGLVFDPAGGQMQVGVDQQFGDLVTYDGAFTIAGTEIDILRIPEAVNYWRELRNYQSTRAATKTEILLLMTG